MQSTRIRQQKLLQLIIMGLLVLPVAGQPIDNQETGAYEWRSGEPVGVGSGVALVFDVGDAPDASVQADLQQLLPELWDLAPAMGAAGVLQEEIVVRYRGKGRVGKRLTLYPQPESGRDMTLEEEPDTLSWVAFNLATLNEYEVRFPRTLLRGLHAVAVATGLNRAVTLSPGQQDDADPSITPDASSNNTDNRVRFYGVDAPVTHWEHQRVSDFGGCTVTLIGPRHVITAAHCVYNSGAQDPWTDDVPIRVARNGTSWLDEVWIDNDNIPDGEVLWYWVPTGWMNTGQAEYDISLIVTPRRIGMTTGGWMGWSVLTAATLSSAAQSLWNVGYPGCDVFTPDGTPRIDEPYPCSEDHLYGDVNACSPAQFSNLDGNGWARNFRHSCDASAGQSGSPIYLNYNGEGWGVTGIHIQSVCGTTSSNPCNTDDAVHPLRATRITPEYSGVISYFRQLYP